MLSMLAGNAVAFAPQSMLSQSRVSQSRVSAMEMKQNPVIIGVAADSGCGKSTFMRRLTSIFGGESKMLDIGRETNTLISEMTTVICLDDYHKWDRTGRASNPEYPDGITALDEKCQDWDKMAADVTDLKAGKTVSKPIYNHITGELDPYEEVPATPYLESQMCNTGTKFYGELTEQIVKNKDAPGSDNGTGLMQTLCSFKIREVYEKLTK